LRSSSAQRWRWPAAPIISFRSLKARRANFQMDAQNGGRRTTEVRNEKFKNKNFHTSENFMYL
jgi:hypothetical protein